MKKKKTKMRATSIEAFYYILENLGDRQEEILKAVKHLKICSNMQISKYLNLPINCVTGRIKEMRDFAIIREYKKDICPYTKRRVSYWFIPSWMEGVLLDG